MRLTILGSMFALMSASASAQQPTPPGVAAMKSFASSADVAAFVAKARSERKEDQGIVVSRLLQLAPYNVNIEYRVAVANAAVHEREAELFYVIDGSATMVTGGQLAGSRRRNAENLTGTGIDGGKAQHVAKGDVVMVPEGTPHWFSAIDGSVVLLSLHLPRPPGTTP